jgi:hypothetical protein
MYSSVLSFNLEESDEIETQKSFLIFETASKKIKPFSAAFLRLCFECNLLLSM